MKFNLLEISYVTYSGTVFMSLEDIANILSTNGNVTISGSGDDNIWIFGDIVDRISVYQIRYYFNSTTDSGTVASGIHFYYKNDSVDSYSNLMTQLGNGFYYAEIPDLSAPRYIRLNHTVSGTAITGTILGFEVLNNDDVIDFGSDGDIESTTVITTLDYLDYNDYIKEIEIYNDGDTVATAHIFLDPQYDDVDNLISISASSAGPWVFARNTNYIIANGDNWDGGQYYHTSTTGIADGKLRLNPGYTVGTYTTPIFKNDSVKFAYIDMLQTAISGSIIATDSNDCISTIQIRSSSSKPFDYNVYRVLYYKSQDHNQFWYKDYLLTTDTEVYDSYDATGVYFGEQRVYGSYYYTFDSTQFVINKDTQKTAYIFSGHRNYYCYFTCSTYHYIDLYILSHTGVQEKHIVLALHNYPAADEPNHRITSEMKFDSDGGIWLYIHLDSNFNAGYTLVSAGYYLLHLNSNLNVTYNSGVWSSDFISGSWSPVINDTSIWYCHQAGTSAVIKLSATGTTEVSYEEVTNLKGVTATSDGGCWFIDGDNIYKLDSSGVLIDSMTNLEVDYELTFIEHDVEDEDFLWIVDGVYVKRIYLDGRVYSSTYLEGFSVRRISAAGEGLWVYCTEGDTGDQYAKYIGKSSSGVEKTIECVNGDGAGDPSDIGVKYVSYDSPVLGSMIPLSDDTTWNDSLSWNKAVTDNTLLPREEYNQLKLTLRRPSTDINYPAVENIYYQDSVELQNIYPGQSKTLYLKISIPVGMTVSGDYSSMLRVWWELPAP